MFKRQIIKDLTNWSNRADRKPLILRGARQVGKTTVVLDFANKYKQFIHLNLENKRERELFERADSFESLLDTIFFLAKKQKNVNPTLLFIDEIQNSGEAIKSLRYFFEKCPEIHVIAAGSLLETALNHEISFPVGRVEFLPVRPFSFSEYLEAIDESRLLEKINEIELNEFYHNILAGHFKDYSVIGGMPEIIQKYVNTKDLVSLGSVYDSLIAGYADDVEKYATSNASTNYIRHIIRTGMNYAGQRIKFEKFGESEYRSREMGESFRLLEKTMLIELSYPVSQSQFPLLPNFKKSPRLYWLDIGLVNYASGTQFDVFSSVDITSAWRGISAEIVVGQELLAYDSSILAKRYFWTRESKNALAEIDFLFSYQGKLIPIEVKSGEKGTMKSLHSYMESAPHSFGIRIWNKRMHLDVINLPSGKTYTLISIPFYLISKLNTILDRIVPQNQY
jgi:predicted AAA+ superfamily ATPase